MKKKFIISVNIDVILLLGLTIGIFITQYRIVELQGYIILACELLCTIIFLSYSGIENDKRIGIVTLTYLIFCIYCIIQSIIILGRVDSIKDIIYRQIGLLFFSMVFTKRNNFIQILFFFRNIGIISSLIGCLELFFKKSFFSDFISVETRIFATASLGTYATRVRTFFLHPIICAAFCTITWFLLIGFPLKSNLLNNVMKILTIICLLGTQARSSWIAFIITNIFYIFTSGKRYKKIRISKKTVRYSLISSGIILFIFAFYSKSIYTYANIFWNRWIDGLNVNNYANYNRVTMIKIGINWWLRGGLINKLFGYGDGTAQKILSATVIRGWDIAVDNQFLTLLLDNGLIGLLLFTLILIYVVIWVIKTKNSYIIILGSCIISLYISSFFYEMLTWIFLTEPLILFICIFDVLCKENDKI